MALRKGDLLQGSLNLLVLKVLESGPNHGYAIATRLHHTGRHHRRRKRIYKWHGLG